LATKGEVEAKLRELIARLNRADTDVRGSLADALPERRLVEVVVTDLDAAYWTEMTGGRMGKLHRGAATSPDIRIRAASDPLISLIDGKTSLFSSYLGGQVKVEASFTDLMRLRKLT
jgi:hypothetical protein